MIQKTILILKRGIMLLIPIVLLFIWSCSNNKSNEEEVEKELEVDIDSTAGTLVKFNNTLFSIPSPYQIAMLVKKSNSEYNKEYLNSLERVKNYTNNFKKALNLGVYGTDLGYLNIYEQTPEALSYFNTVKTLSQELGIMNAFDKHTVQRVESNMGKKDSLLFIIANSYRKADEYLKDNNRNNAGVLILAGGWVESLHLLTQICKQNKDQELINRVGEQKHPLDNLIKVLSPFYNQSEEYSEFIDALIDLAYEFDGVDYVYEYEKPTVFADKKLTIINSKAKISISDEQLKTISEKVLAIRNQIVK